MFDIYFTLFILKYKEYVVLRKKLIYRFVVYYKKFKYV